MRNKAALKVMHRAFKSNHHDVLPVTHEISDMAIELVEQCALSQSLYLADAPIAATAMSHDLVLLSANDIHFSAIKRLKLHVLRA